MDEAQGIKRQQRGEETRLALLEAGVELLQEETMRDLLRAISSRAVAERAMRSTGSFFHHWESTDDYLSDLLEYVLRPGSVAQVEEMGAMLDSVVRDPAAPVALLRAICEQDFRNTVNDPLLPVQMLLWSRHSDTRASGALARFYGWTDEVAVSRYELIAERWRRQPRTPFDWEEVSIIFTALLEGLAVRYAIEPDRVPASLFADAVLALLPTMLCGPEDDTTIERLVDGVFTRKNPDPS